jgi:2-(1,2-epoxy-1,2-dihydrophenyl)acetyl-CoA isomerase
MKLDSLKKLQVTLNDFILQVTLSRPDNANAFDLEMIEELVDTLAWADFAEEVRVITFIGAGKHFCAGGDVLAMQEKREMFAGASDELRKRYQSGIQRIPLIMEKLQKPTIAIVNGAAIGAGCDFAAMADIRLGSEKTKMGETFNKLALVPGDGGTYFLPRVVGFTKATEMFLTGRIYNATECLEMGLLNAVYDSSDLEAEGEKWAKQISGNAPMAVQMTKKALKLSHLKELQTSLDLLAAYQGITQRSNDHFIGIDNLLNKKSNPFKGD